LIGDGPDDGGEKVVGNARDEAVRAGIVINGLPIESPEAKTNMSAYYERNVIGGPGSFFIPVVSPGSFTEAVRLELAREIAQRPRPTEVSDVILARN
jgi:hypothetical protein